MHLEKTKSAILNLAIRKEFKKMKQEFKLKRFYLNRAACRYRDNSDSCGYSLPCLCPGTRKGTNHQLCQQHETDRAWAPNVCARLRRDLSGQPYLHPQRAARYLAGGGDALHQKRATLDLPFCALVL